VSARVKNYQLAVIRPSWKGNLLDSDNRFVDEEYPFLPKLSEVWKWKSKRNPQHDEKRSDPFRLNVIHDLSFLDDTLDCIIWLGHASFYIRLNGVTMLIDPVFYNIPFVRRYVPHALSPKEIGRVDYLMISHDHRDHCQKQSIREVVQNNPGVEILTGLQMDTQLKRWVSGTKMQCAGWYQQYRTLPSIAICFLPTRHWGKRTANDTNRRLWGAFMISSDAHTVYFGGDTAYSRYFLEASEMFPSIDVALLGVGAYKPQWFMSRVHMGPEEAVRASNELRAKAVVPMHYATFDLSDEPPGEAPKILLNQKENKLLNADLKLLDPGQILRL